MAQVAGPASEMVFDYLAETECIPEAERSTASHLKGYVGKLGEPMITSFDPEKVEEDFNLEGEWAILENDDPSDQQERYVEGRSDVYALPPLFWCLNLRRTC